MKSSSRPPQPRWVSAITLATMVAILASSVYALSTLLNWMLESITGLPKEVHAALLTAFATVLSSVIVVVFGKYFERRLGISQDLRNKKAPVYEDLFRFFVEMGAEQRRSGTPMSEEKVMEFFWSFSPRLMVWGSDQIIREWSDLQRKFAKLDHSSESSEQLLFDLERFFLSMRKDLGHRNRGIRQGDLLRTIVKDVDEFTSSRVPPKAAYSGFQ